MAEPKKPVTYHHTDTSIKDHAVYAVVVMQDADGKLWKFQGASFYFDLSPYQHDAAKERS